jgi:hypothetical protein
LGGLPEEGQAQARAKRPKLSADALPGWGDDAEIDGVEGQGFEGEVGGGGESRLVNLSHLRPCTKVLACLSSSSSSPSSTPSVWVALRMWWNGMRCMRCKCHKH